MGSQSSDAVLTTAAIADDQAVSVPRLPPEAHVSVVGLLAPEGEPPPPPTPRYQEEMELGRGGMGRMLSVFDRDLNRRVAMKTLVSAARVSRRFVDEAQVSAQLEHPNVLPVYDFGVDHEARRGARGAARRDQPAARARSRRAATVHLRAPRADHPAGLSRARLRARSRREPPRHQAGEHPSRAARRGLPRGLGHRRAARRRGCAVGERRRRERLGEDGRGDALRRDARLHAARAHGGDGARLRRRGRRLLAVRGALRAVLNRHRLAGPARVLVVALTCLAAVVFSAVTLLRR